MAKTPYQPPQQSKLGQLVDTLFLLTLVLASLFLPVYLGLAGGGKTTLDIWPRLRSSPADSAAIVITNCKGLFQLSSNAQDYNIKPAMIYGYAFAARERL